MSNNRIERGIHEMEKIGEGTAKNIMDSLKDISEDFSEHLISSFGDIFSRSILTIQEREMITIASIVTLGFAPDRLKHHIKGALNVGVSKEKIAEIIMHLSLYAGFPAAVNAMLVAKEIIRENSFSE